MTEISDIETVLQNSGFKMISDEGSGDGSGGSEGSGGSGDGNGSPASNQSSQNQQDYGYLKELFGDEIDSPEKLKNSGIIDKIKGYDGLSSKVKELESKDSTPNYSSEDVKGYDLYLRKNPTGSYSSYKTLVDFDKSKITDPLDILVTSKVMENPEFKGHEDALKDSLAKQYSQSVEFEDSEKQLGLIRLKKDAEEAAQKISTLKDEVLSSSTSSINEDKTQKLEENYNKWASEQVFDGLKKDFSKIQIKLPGDNGETLEFAVSDSDNNALMGMAQDYIKKTGVEPTPEGIQSVANQLYNIFVTNRLPQILSDYKNQIEAKLRVEFDKELHVARGLNPGAPAGQHNDQKSPIYSGIMESLE